MAITYSSDASDFCRHLIFSILNVPGAKSAAILTLGATESLLVIGGYGEFQQPQGESWVTSDSVWAKAIRENQPVTLTVPESEDIHVAIPLFQNGLVQGALSLICSAESGFWFLNAPADLESLKLAAEYYLYDYQSGSTRTNRGRVQPSVVPTKLTQRQMVILKWIARGKTYSSISREMHISESLVKQEALRLFRFFGVDNRVKVIEKAKEAGYFDSPGGSISQPID